MRLLAPIPVDRRPRRFIQLIVGLLLYGITMGMMVRAVLGLDPWDVFHQGLTDLLNDWVPISYGAVITVVSVVVLLLWIPLRQRPGAGTIANAAIIGFTTDATLAVLGEFTDLTLRIVVLALAILGNALAGALYIGAGLGPGPRDGLMTGIVARGIGSIRLVRTTIELSVLGIGWLLGGVVGVGTVVYALAIGPLLHVLLPRLQVRSATPVEPVPAAVPSRRRRSRQAPSSAGSVSGRICQTRSSRRRRSRQAPSSAGSVSGRICQTRSIDVPFTEAEGR